MFKNIFLGVGWSMAGISLIVSIYYNVIVAWTVVYLYIIVTGRFNEWASCRNEFNTIRKFYFFFFLY